LQICNKRINFTYNIIQKEINNKKKFFEEKPVQQLNSPLLGRAGKITLARFQRDYYPEKPCKVPVDGPHRLKFAGTCAAYCG
jgi:hypothetical protein